MATLQVSNSAGTARRVLSLSANASTSLGPVLTSLQHIEGTVSVPFYYQTTTSGPEHNNIARGLPPGLSMDILSGVISGIPRQQGTFYVQVTMQPRPSNTCGTVVILVITIQPGAGPLPEVTSTLSLQGQVDMPFNSQVMATNSPYTFTAAGLPPGLTMSPSGSITGTPTEAGTYSVRVDAFNASGMGSAVITMTISPATVQLPVFTSAPTARGIAGKPFWPHQVTATGDVTMWNASNLPPGLSFNSQYAYFYGTPYLAGTYSVSVTAAGPGGSAAQTLSITIDPSGTTIPTPSQARPGGYRVGNAAASHGSDVSVPVFYAPSPDQNGTSTLSFTAILPANVTATGFTPGPVATDAGLSLTFSPATATVLLMKLGKMIAGPGLLGTLQLHIDSGLPSATVPLTLADTQESLWVDGASQYIPIPMPVQDGALTIQGVAQTNGAPSASAGTPQTIRLPSGAFLSATASDDGLPAPPGQLTYLWSMKSGPGSVSFSNAAARDTNANFSAAGVYVLTFTAFDGVLSASSDVTITVNPPITGDQPPTVNNPASANPNPVTGMSTILSVLGADNNGEPNLTYTWSTIGNSPAAVFFTPNGTNASKTTMASFSAAGHYTMQVTLRDAVGLTATSQVVVTVQPTPASIAVSPPTASVPTGGSQLFSATLRDQFNAAVPAQPSFAWSVSGGGTIDPSGFFSAGLLSGGPYTVSASAAGLTGSAQVTIPGSGGGVPPTVNVAAAVVPSVITGQSATVSVLGAHPNGESILTYQWNVFGSYEIEPTFTPNGTNAAKLSAVTFQRAGNYNFLVTIEAPNSGVAISSVTQATVLATPTTLSVSPAGASVETQGTLAFSAQVFDQFNQPIATPPAITWSISGGGSINSATGVLTAGPTAGGPFTVTATAAGKSGSTTFMVTPPANTPPTVETPASATPNPVTGTTTTLRVLGADNGGEASLLYSWAVTGSAPAPVTFSQNGTNAAKEVTATFARAGTYALLATIEDAGGLTVTDTVQVTVQATPAHLTVAPSAASVAPNTAQLFVATAFDQFNRPIQPPPAFNWSVSGGGTINAATGVFIAGASTGGPHTITATLGPLSQTASVTITPEANQPPVITLPASAAPNPVQAAMTNLAALASDDGGDGLLTYTWEVLGNPPAPVSFSQNGSYAANSTLVYFSRIGTYLFRVTIRDQGGLSAVSEVSVTVNPVYAELRITPPYAELLLNETLAFSAQALDQFGEALVPQPPIVWSSDGGSIDDSRGFFTAPSAPGLFQVSATGGGLSGWAQVWVVTQRTPTTIPTPNLDGIHGRTYRPQDELSFTYPLDGVTFEWNFAPPAAAGRLAAPSFAPSGAATTQTPALSLAPLNLDPGPYVLTVTVRRNWLSSSNTARILIAADDLSGIRVYPNPWRSDRDAGRRDVTFDGLSGNVTIKLFRTDGHWIRTLGPGTGTIPWDLKDDSGRAVASGLYLYRLQDDAGRTSRGKLVVIR